MTPKEAREILDTYALRLQKSKDPNTADNEWMFGRLMAYVHKYLWGLSYNHYVVRGQEGKDLYQEGLIALFTKAIPKYDPDRNMSFLNFAKMCVRRHLITILNTSRHRKKDLPMNQALPLDQVMSSNDSDDSLNGGTLMNIIYDETEDFVVDLCREEDKSCTLVELESTLSRFEQSVLTFYLQDHSYRQIARLVSKEHDRRYNEKSIDNALLRIRNKAAALREEGVDLPLFNGHRRRRRKKRKNTS